MGHQKEKWMSSVALRGTCSSLAWGVWLLSLSRGYSAGQTPVTVLSSPKYKSDKTGQWAPWLWYQQEKKSFDVWMQMREEMSNLHTFSVTPIGIWQLGHWPDQTTCFAYRHGYHPPTTPPSTSGPQPVSCHPEEWVWLNMTGETDWQALSGPCSTQRKKTIPPKFLIMQIGPLI